MEEPFSDQLYEMADSMGIALYQRLTLTEASLFLRCPVSDIKGLQKRRKIDCIQVTSNQIEFFGYQLLEYLLSTVSGRTPIPPKAPSSDKIIRSKEVQEITSLSRTTLWRLERKGEFPARVALCTGSVGWRLSEVERWINERK